MRGKVIDGVSNAYLRWSTPDVALNDVTRTTPGLDGPTHEEAKTLTETTVSVPTSFADLGVREDICQALEGVGIVSPFPIQAMSIPIAVEGTDLIGQARTGTGKTLAFGITILLRITLPGDEGWEELTTKGKPQALVMCPTRELALQVSKDISTAASVRGARVLTGLVMSRRLTHLKRGSMLSSVLLDAFLTYPSARTSICPMCASSFLTRPTRCLISASCLTSRISSDALRPLARRCCFRPLCRPRLWP